MKKILLSFVLAGSLVSAHADWLSALGLGKSSTNSAATGTAALAALSDTQVVGGLKDALGNGLQHAIANLGHDGGFLTNVEVKIPLPEKLQSAEKILRAAGQDKLADEFVTTMNHAAEQAVPAAASVFGDAVKSMSIDDAKAVLTGPPDSATQFFRRTTSTNLYAKFYPIVQKATAAAGVTSSYKNMMAKVSGGSSFGGALSGMANSYLGSDALDVDAYVTNKTLDGLFKMVADEEKNIRANPVARTTDLMKTVFGAVSK
ncbi:MAG TPA: DUF4197 domain-containing protein [Verrucomicrobiae bacterium]|nr:DUF4197 domain-containing protein [Verrucomicrobiae bacterium]